MVMLEVMEKYGWDWYTYQEQPVWIIDAAIQKMTVEAKLREHNEKNNG